MDIPLATNPKAEPETLNEKPDPRPRPVVERLRARLWNPTITPDKPEGAATMQEWADHLSHLAQLQRDGKELPREYTARPHLLGFPWPQDEMSPNFRSEEALERLKIASVKLRRLEFKTRGIYDRLARYPSTGNPGSNEQHVNIRAVRTSVDILCAHFTHNPITPTVKDTLRDMIYDFDWITTHTSVAEQGFSQRLVPAMKIHHLRAIENEWQSWMEVTQEASDYVADRALRVIKGIPDDTK